MKIQLNRIGKGVHLEATNEQGSVVHTDGAPEIGGMNKGMRPMQLLLVALGSCSSMDVLSILKKQKQHPEGYKVTVDGEREKGKIPSLFREIHIHFEMTGKLDEKKVARAIELSMNKYCSVSKTLEPTANITSSYEIIEKL
jgi:putative redox protein